MERILVREAFDLIESALKRRRNELDALLRLPGAANVGLDGRLYLTDAKIIAVLREQGAPAVPEAERAGA